MFKRVILLVIDGLGDRPVEEFAGLTPIEVASTGNLDKLAKYSECGMMHPLGRGKNPRCEIAHLAIFGYDRNRYYPGLAPIEAAGLGFELMDGDIALTASFENIAEDNIIKDRRVERIPSAPSPEAHAVQLDSIDINGIRFFVKAGPRNRAGIIVRGEGLSGDVSGARPHESGETVREIVPTRDTPEAAFTADILNRFISTSRKILTQFNSKRAPEKKALLPNFLLVHSAGQHIKTPSFKDRYGLSSCCIAGSEPHKSLGAYLGMKVLKVPGATGMADTDLEMKFKIALSQLPSTDFVFVHVKAADLLAKDGNPQGKKDFFEKVDSALRMFRKLPQETLLVVTADHSTPCELAANSADPVPVMFHGSGVRVDKVDAFNERACCQGGLGFIEAKDIMPHILNLMGRLELDGI
ncbi:MAG: 2,3-bisphosphoglycerate-independent phosphoglycerate mutase [bacterium]|nr:2,3-bisphosphoglycerate-independent phosphoglycerate mutase [bacterium]